MAGGGALSVGLATGGARSRFAWPDERRAAVSLTYDDTLNSQLDNALPQLDALNLKATFFLTKENMEERETQWIAVSKQGHEIANHTASHPCKLKPYTPQRFLAEEIEPTEQYLDAKFDSPKPRAFAYPCGFVKLGQGSPNAEIAAYESVVRPNFYAARTVEGPPNDPALVPAQRFFLNAYEPTYDHDDASLAVRYIDQAIASGHWAILIFHDVLERRIGPGDTSKRVHEAILRRLARQPVWCAPMREVFSHVMAQA
jgi:peptidoglycan/xylan/chitin deacetylase (PgdA/CDA1 family)